MHYAARWGHKEIAELLIQNGADVNVKDDWSEQTPLHKAARWGHKEVAELLIAEGADVNAKDYEPFSDKENTPLDWATHPDNPDASAELADLLRKHGGQKLSEFMILHSPLLRSFDKRFSFSFDTKEGKVYEVQDSLNLVNWKAIKTYNGTGRLKWFHAETDHGSPKNFYRVNVVE